MKTAQNQLCYKLAWVLCSLLACHGNQQEGVDSGGNDASSVQDTGKIQTDSDVHAEDAMYMDSAYRRDTALIFDASVQDSENDADSEPESLDGLTHLRIELIDPMPIGASQRAHVYGVGESREVDLTNDSDLILTSPTPLIEIQDHNRVIAVSEGHAAIQATLSRTGITLFGASELHVVVRSFEGLFLDSAPVLGAWTSSTRIARFVPMVVGWETSLSAKAIWERFDEEIGFEEVAWSSEGDAASIRRIGDKLQVQAVELGSTRIVAEWMDRSHSPERHTTDLEIRVVSPTGEEQISVEGPVDCSRDSNLTINGILFVQSESRPWPRAQLANSSLWNSSDPNVVRPDSCDRRGCRILCIENGEATISATLSWSREYHFRHDIEVWSAGQLDRISVEPSRVEIDSSCVLPSITLTAFPAEGASYSFALEGDRKSEHVRLTGVPGTELACCFSYSGTNRVFYHGQTTELEVHCTEDS